MRVEDHIDESEGVVKVRPELIFFVEIGHCMFIILTYAPDLLIVLVAYII